ncbi:type 1 glutamine amidotransferase domain-containing protein [Paraglaciecola sp. Hal342]|jgi:putative intracellular protease/amidase|uniref:type 1 glutamine amidotransferase domain-containing protein n=1 Tax=Paraglaciecola chathamensis TaxID=368405 RepID=UPI00270F74D8|nr:type 1 glutamine amidotransferase domain-containing protein [Paraglaciecola chathamensis]MDO6561529.1 type 1 glutamine amidotransferase domain-containing protein [Paraglaciecola chathamensis]
MKNVLIILTNHATLGTTDEANGTFSPELTHALHAFVEAGYRYDLVSIKGGEAPVYGVDMEDDQINSDVFKSEDLATKLANTKKASDVNPDDYDAVFYPGGFGLLSDLADDENVAKLTATIFEKGAVVGAVCHGPAGLLPIKLSSGKYLIEDIMVTGFTREEEVEYGTINKIPFLLEEALTRRAGQYAKIAPWGEYVIKQDRVITGQNPASAGAVGKAMVERLAQ